MSYYRILSRSVISVVPAGMVATLVYHRPLPDPLDKNDDKYNGADRKAYLFTSKYSLSDTASLSPSILYQISQQVVVFSCVNIARFVMYSFGQFKIIQDDNYSNFVAKIQYKPSNQSIITVTNHRSMFDDPFLTSSLLPYKMSIMSKYLRYSLCAQEFCFNSRVRLLLLVPLLIALCIHIYLFIYSVYAYT